MRSNSTKADTTSSTRQNKLLRSLPLALTAIAAVLALATAADAAQRMGAAGGFGGVSAGGFAGKLTGGVGRIVGPTGHPSITGNPGGRPGKGGGNTGGDGGRVSGGNGGNDRPHRPRFPKHPIVVGVPTGVIAVTPVLGSTNSAAGAVNQGGGSGPKGSPIVRGSSSGVPPANERRYVPDEVLFKLASSVPKDTIDALGRRLRLDPVASFTSNDVTLFRWKIPDRRSVPAVVRSLEAERIVLAAQPNYIYQLQQQQTLGDTPSTTVGRGDSGQYALAKLRLPEAHELAKGEKVLIAVIDSGVDASHPELEGMIVDSFDALTSDEMAHAHGTAVAGAIVAHARLIGAAPEARILAVRAFSAEKRTPEATTYSINQGIDWAIERGARIVNMSFTGPRDPSTEQKMAQARNKGLILIAAAGNAGAKSQPLYPAAYSSVIAVTATDADDKLFEGANRGSHIAVAAPGVDILLPAPAAGYQVTTGTSFAAAELSGIAALMLERRPELGQDEVRKALIATARDLGPKGVDPQFGAGLVDAYQAIRSLEPVSAGAAARVIPASSRQ
jgi:hypothetical protein